MSFLRIVGFVLAAAITMAQPIPKSSDRWNLGVPPFTEPKAIPQPTRQGPQLILGGQLNQGRCSVPLLKVETNVNVSDHMTVPPIDPKATMPKVTLPAPPCENAPR